MAVAAIAVATMSGLASAADPYYDIDVWVNVTMQNLSSSKVNISGLNTTLLVEKLNVLAQDPSGIYTNFLNSVVTALLEEGGSVEVLACLAGSYTDSVTGLCIACPAGKYSSVINAASSSVCQSCGPGTYSNVSGASTSAVCANCPVGTFSSALGASSLSQCASCPDKATTVGGSGSQSAESCVCMDGYVSLPSEDGLSTRCVICPAGYYCYGGNGYECIQRGDIASSQEGSKAVTDCYCKAGYYGVAISANVGEYCLPCGTGMYCPGYLVNGVAQRYSCPENSMTTGQNAKSISECACAASYRTQVSDYAGRRFRVDATRCMCNVSAGVVCETGSIGCDNCPSSDRCIPGGLGGTKVLTCPQGYVNLVYGSTYGPDTVPIKWAIAPPGADAVTIKFSMFNTISGDVLTVSQCRSLNCSVMEKVRDLQGNLGNSLPSVKTASGWPVMRLSWVTGVAGGGQGWQATYGSILPCESSTIPLTPTRVEYLSTGALEPYVAPLDASLPVVAWLGDSLGFDLSLPRASYVSIDVRYAPHETGVSAIGEEGIGSWVPPSLGVYYIVDPSMPSTRYRTLHVVPLEPSKRVAYYNVEDPNGLGAYFTLTGAGGIGGTSSPDIVLTVGDTLVLSRLSDAHGVMLLKSFSAAGSTPTWELVTAGVSGQSSLAEMVSSLTWDTTAGAAPGVYYYASAQQPGKVKVGRVILVARPGGQQCIECKQGEYCYDGNPLRCPANSNSPPKSTRIEDCTCVAGHAREITDMAAYVNSQAVDSGGRHSCVVSNGDGALWCWGANEAFQLGLGRSSASEAAPQRVSLSGVTQVALGDDFTCVIHGVGAKVRCWGDNYYGQLGLGSDMLNSGSTGPASLGDAKLGGTSAGGDAIDYSTRYLSCGGRSCCAIVYRLSQLAMTCWGLGKTGQLGRGGAEVGYGKSGSIGTVTGKTPSDARYSYTSVGSDTSLVPFGARTPIAVTMGGQHACGLFEEGGGSVMCWGKNTYGALGIGSSDETQVFNPTAVDIGAGKSAKAVNCYNFVCCVVILGVFEVKCWGMGGGGRLGVTVFNVGATPGSMGANLQSVPLGTAQYAIDVNVGSTQTCALMGNNYVKCWGLVAGLVLGDNPPLDMYDLLPSLNMSGGRVALQISGKGGTTCAVLSDYKVACWGNNDWKQLGGTPVKDAASAPLVNMTMVNLTGGAEALHSSGTPQSLVCSVCAANYYCDGGGGAPAQCPNGTVSFAASTSPLDCKCLDGYASVYFSDACRLCTGAEWCVNGVSNPCPAHSSSVADGAKEIAQCACVPGYTGANGGSCVACPAGTYKAASGSGSCTPCPYGTYSPTVGLNGSQGCLPCRGGTFSASAGGAIECTVCGTGKAAKSGSSVCVSCGSGFFSTASSDGCQPCPAGTFDEVPYEGTPGTCSNCSKGYASSALNATSSSTCKWCPAGTKAAEGSGVCSPCAAGEYSNGGTELCDACPANSNSLGGTGLSGCGCVAGFYKVMGADGVTFECVRCPGGRWSGANASACTLCPAGSASSEEGATTSGVCAACSKGNYADAGSTGCSACAAWTIAAADGQGVCQNCSFGEWAAAGSSSCSACPAGKYSLSRIGSASGCLSCPRGSYCVGSVEAKASGAAQVQTCPAGSFVAEGTLELKGANQCGDCTAGSFCPTPTMKSACPAGTSSPARSSSQLQCTCDQGYVCSYTKLINAVVHLQMSYNQFTDAGVQNAFKNAVAQASKTTAGNVKIIKFFEAPKPGGGGRRRLLSAGDDGDGQELLSLSWPGAVDLVEASEGGGDDGVGSAVEERGVGSEALGGVVRGVHVFLEVQGGGEDLDGLDRLLVGAGLDPSLDHAWYSPHLVSARRLDGA